MEIFILDALLRRIDVVDEFVSMIWTERYAVKGDFSLVTLSTNANRNRFVKDTLLMIPDSKRIMRVNTIEDTVDEDNGATLTVKGYELVSVFEQRIFALREVVGVHTGMIRPTTYILDRSPLEILDAMVWVMCVATGAPLTPGDVIPFLNDYSVTPGSLYPASNIPEPMPGGIIWQQKVASLYSALVDVCKAYDLGFRLYKDPNSSKLYFEGYNGLNRTTNQTDFPPVIFSSDMSNLQNTTEYTDNLNHFNVVVAIYEYKNEVEDPDNPQLTLSEIVSDPELVYSSGGFDQKTKYISITQLPEGMLLVDVPAYLQQLAAEELTRCRPINLYDGEIDQNSDFVYERDYFLGDIVEIRGNNGGVAFMRVVEQIIKQDSNGKSSFPSLVNKGSISPGTWLSWKYDVDWEDMGSGEFWNNQ